jgi:deoxycytidylate deaminase
MMGPCAKTVVTCTLTAPTGERFIGRNDCANPQPVCPRDPGEGYEKCKTVCDQRGHAEEQALALAGEKAKGARAYIEGHTWACQNCQVALFAAGVASLTIGSPPGHWVRTESQQITDLHRSNNDLLERARKAERRLRALEAPC